MNTWLNRLCNLAMLALGACSQLIIIRDSFDCQADSSIWIWLLLLCVLLWFSTSFHRGIWLGMPLSAVLLFLAYRVFDASPALELQDLIDHISGAFYTHITHPGDVYPYINAASSQSFVLLLLGFFLAAYLTTALHSRSLRISLSMLETLPIFTACVMVNSEMPSLPTLGMLLFWFLLLVCGNSFSPGGSLYRTVLCTLPPIFLLLGALLMLHNPDNYNFSDYDRSLNARFNHFANYFDLLTGLHGPSDIFSDETDPNADSSAPRPSYQNCWDTEDNRMELSNPFDEEQSELRLMMIRAETSNRIYLRARSYGDYAGTGWLPAEELKSGTSLPFTAYAAESSPKGIKRELELRTLVDLNALCIPYYAAVSSESDSYVTQEEQINYRVNYIDYRGNVFDLRLPADAAYGESVYRSHAHSVFTRLPERTREQALAICSQAGLSASDPNIIQSVAAYVQQTGQYDLNTPAYPSDDYAIYFLTESHRGYCIHYATAAAVLYRALGIPARVTEGFAVQTRAGEFSPVKAGDAHAWVEVYLDGTGWIPVEVTANTGVATAEPSPEPTLVPDPQSQQGAPPSPEAGAAAPDQTDDGPGGGSAGGPDEEEEHRSFPWLLLLILPGLILLFALWYVLARARFLSQTQNPNRRKAVLACWRYARRAAAFGGQIPEDIVHLAERVAFSPHAIHPEEIALCREELNALIEEIYPGLLPFAKFRFRFLRGLK